MDGAESTETQQAPVTETGGEETTTETQGPDFTPVFDRMDKLGETFGDRFEQLEQRLPAQEDFSQQEPGFQNGEPQQQEQYLQDEHGNVYDQYGNPVDPAELANQFDPQAYQQQLQQQVDQRVQQALAPVQDMFLDQQIAGLEERYPALRNEETATAVVQAAEQAAQQYAQAAGNPGLAQTLATNPSFVEQVYLAQKGAEQATSETPAGAEGEGIELEAGGASNPGSGEPDLSDRIVNARNSGSNFFS